MVNLGDRLADWWYQNFWVNVQDKLPYPEYTYSLWYFIKIILITILYIPFAFIWIIFTIIISIVIFILILVEFVVEIYIFIRYSFAIGRAISWILIALYIIFMIIITILTFGQFGYFTTAFNNVARSNNKILLKFYILTCSSMDNISKCVKSSNFSYDDILKYSNLRKLLKLSGENKYKVAVKKAETYHTNMHFLIFVEQFDEPIDINMLKLIIKPDVGQLS